MSLITKERMDEFLNSVEVKLRSELIQGNEAVATVVEILQRSSEKNLCDIVSCSADAMLASDRITLAALLQLACVILHLNVSEVNVLWASSHLAGNVRRGMSMTEWGDNKSMRAPTTGELASPHCGADSYASITPIEECTSMQGKMVGRHSP
ncbi:hypothetical protein CPLU01_13598 [Colletotrichum plurivorum]|uniref:Uncharacterized protein n=1 Tax=Colletotrichum plurivorum TaxID=2175906 RepID=A0A8H6N1Z5_9PEZI|nr:hypothetical protein CPLU01_13598 [Colletotrichum plurivorum]